MSDTTTIQWLYHVPRSQVWAGSRGHQSGRIHAHLNGADAPLCRPGRIPWYPRDPLPGETRCARCVTKAQKQGLL